MKKGYDTVESVETWPRFTVLKRNRVRQVEMYFGYIITCGILYILSLWVQWVQLWPYDEDENGSYVLIEDEDLSFTIKQISKETINTDSISLNSSSTPMQIEIFTYRYLKFYRKSDCFKELTFDSAASGKTFQSQKSISLTDEQIIERRKLFGSCLIDIKIPSIFALIHEGALHPFFIFQLFSCILWYFEEYLIYSIAILIMSLVSLIFNLVQVRQCIKAVQDLALYDCPVQVYREKWVELSSKELVPGDRIKLTEGIAMPCDAVLLNGTCLVDESMLTGESLLIVKEPISDSSSLFYRKDKKFTVSAGTLPKICRFEPTAVVVSTGFSTAKGELVRSVLFPKPNRYSFYADSFKFIGIMAIIGMIGLIWAFIFLMIQDSGLKIIIIRSLDIITIVVPPVLPLVLTIGTSFSISRLKKLNISCISLPAVNAAGRVSIVVFDKTGTITEDWMTLKGIVNETMIDPDEASYEMQENMAVCNSLSYINGKIEGDPQEVAIFTTSKWEAVDSNNNRWSVLSPKGEVQVLQVFHFSSETKRMGVIIQTPSGLYFHLKGAPEVIKPFCVSLPESYDSSMTHYTKEGFRLLACAFKKIETFDPDQSIESLETGLNYLGLLVLENPLKTSSVDTIQTLQLSNIRCVISTGDSYLTGVSVAKVCGIVNTKLPLYTGEFQKGRLVWKDPSDRVGFLPKKCNIALTGEILEHMHKNSHPDLQHVIKSGSVFGRMFPHHKILLIELLQGEDTMVAMVGDGANDCGALKKADVGLSLSKAEASIAAPFSTENISGIIDVLKEGRNALVTSLQSFKFVIMYSFIQFIAVSILYVLENNLTDLQFLYQDLIIILPISVSMANSEPFESLAKELPPGNLFSLTIIGSLLGHLFINMLFQAASYCLMLPFDWYEHVSASTDEPMDTIDNSVIFMMASFQILIAGLIFNIGPPYRKNTLENFWFTVATTFIVLMTIYLLMLPETIGSWFNLVDIEPVYRWILAILALANLICNYLHEKIFMPKIEGNE